MWWSSMARWLLTLSCCFQRTVCFWAWTRRPSSTSRRGPRSRSTCTRSYPCRHWPSRTSTGTRRWCCPPGPLAAPLSPPRRAAAATTTTGGGTASAPRPPMPARSGAGSTVDPAFLGPTTRWGQTSPTWVPSLRAPSSTRWGPSSLSLERYMLMSQGVIYHTAIWHYILLTNHRMLSTYIYRFTSSSYLLIVAWGSWFKNTPILCCFL